MLILRLRVLFTETLTLSLLIYLLLYENESLTIIRLLAFTRNPFAGYLKTRNTTKCLYMFHTDIL